MRGTRAILIVVVERGRPGLVAHSRPELVVTDLPVVTWRHVGSCLGVGAWCAMSLGPYARGRVEARCRADCGVAS